MSDELDLGATIKGFSAGQRVFGRYTLSRILGRGGMGVVWLARDDELSRDAALKFLPEMVAADPTAINEMKREVRRAIDLSHPHIIKTHDFITDGRMAGVSMEYLSGGTLATLRLEEPGQVFTPARISPWVHQLCQALQYAHESGEIVHRDLKPTNLMLDAKGRLKVVDFGIAASISESVSRVSKQVGSSGTPVYMSPQQMMGENPAVTDDVYATGATLYELLTGKPPFHAGNIMMQVQNKPAPPVNERRKLLNLEPVSAEWEETIAACLAKDPAERPQNAAEIADRLGLGGKPAVRPAPAPTARAKPAPEPAAKVAAPQPKGTNKGLFVGVGLAVVMLGGLGWYFGIHAPEQKRQAEIARLEAEGRAVDAARLRNEKEKADAAAREKAEQEQQTFAVVVARIESLLDGAPEAQREATEKAVKDYLAGAPVRYRADVESRWTKRLIGWETHRLSTARGGFRVRTNPDGAEVQVGSLALERSPLTRNDVRLGKYPLIIRAEGYEEWRGEIVVKENDFTDPGVIALVRSAGTLDLKSDPPGAEFTLQQQGRESTRRTGRLPAVLEGLPTGSYTVTARFPGLADVTREVEITRNARTPLDMTFAYGTVQVDAQPAGAEVWRDGRVVGKTPLTLKNFPTGEIALEVRSKGFARQKLTGRLETGRTLMLTTTLKAGGLDDPEMIAQSAMEEVEREQDPSARANMLAGLAGTLQRLGGVSPELLRSILDRQLETARQIQNPRLQLTALSAGVGTAAELDLAYSRTWAEAAVAVIPRITDKSDRTNTFYTASLFWMHPDLADRMATVMDDWFSGNDDEWAWASMVAGLHKRFGNERGAQLMAARAKGPYRDESINNNLKEGAAYRVIDPVLRSLLRSEVEEARRQLRGVTTSLSYGVVAALAYQFMLKDDFETARQMGGRLEANMVPYYPGLLVTYALIANNPSFAESVASGLSDEGDNTRRTDAYRDITQYYARVGMKDKARIAAAQMRNFGNAEYGLGRQQAVPVLVMAGELARARQIAQSVTVSYAADKAYLAAFNAQMFLAIGDTASFERCMQHYAQAPGANADWVYSYQVPMLLSILGRMDEAETYVGRARDANTRFNGRNLIALARLRAEAPDKHEALVDAARPGYERAAMLAALLGLRLEKKQLAQHGL